MIKFSFQLYSTILYEKKILPSNIPLPELLYCFCQGTLFNARILDPDACPSYVFNLMKSCSNGRFVPFLQCYKVDYRVLLSGFFRNFFFFVNWRKNKISKIFLHSQKWLKISNVQFLFVHFFFKFLNIIRLL